LKPHKYVEQEIAFTGSIKNAVLLFFIDNVTQQPVKQRYISPENDGKGRQQKKYYNKQYVI
jgi:hypothetical protein